MSNFFSNYVEVNPLKTAGAIASADFHRSADHARLEQYRVSSGLWWSI